MQENKEERKTLEYSFKNFTMAVEDFVSSDRAAIVKEVLLDLLDVSMRLFVAALIIGACLALFLAPTIFMLSAITALFF